MMVSIVVMGDGDDDGDDDDGVDVDNVDNDAYSRDSCRDDIADIFYDDNDFDGECNKKNGYEIIINVPVVFMALYVMGPNGTHFARAISGPKKVSIFIAHPFQCPS